jgi:L-alanine-DL-glutamate epimerase-like enolase superfamily enzyme
VHDRAGRARAGVMRRLGRQLVGRSPNEATAICRDVYQRDFKAWSANNPRFANQLLAGFEMALWDLVGQQTGLPVYDLLGARNGRRLATSTSCRAPRSTSSRPMPCTPRRSAPP